MDPKVTRSTFTGVFLRALGSNPAAVPLFSHAVFHGQL